MLNSVGLQNPGVEAWLADELPALVATGARVVASIWGTTVGGYEKAAAALAAAPLGGGGGRGQPELPQPGGRPPHVRPPTRRPPGRRWRRSWPRWAAGRRGPSSAPTSPTSSRSRRRPGRRGAAALTLVNTVKGMAIDPSTRRPRLGAGGGGLSGAAIRPVAVRAIFDVHAGPARRAHRGRRRGGHGRARGGAAPGGGVGGAGGHGHLRGPPGVRAGAGRVGGVVPAPPRGAGRRSGRTGPWSSVTA